MANLLYLPFWFNPQMHLQALSTKDILRRDSKMSEDVDDAKNNSIKNDRILEDNVLSNTTGSWILSGSSENNSTQTISRNIMISSAAFNLPNPQLGSVIACELCQLLQIRRSPCRSWSIIFINYSDIWNVTQSY